MSEAQELELKNFTIIAEKKIRFCAYVEAENEKEARHLFNSGEYEDGHDIDSSDERILSIRED